jgi:hypothetical protein
MRNLGRDPDSPALSVLEKRETFFNEALFEPTSQRAELLLTWQMPVERLAVLAVTHEIGHAMCGDASEVRANERAQLLQAGELPTCGKTVLRVEK